MTEQAEIGLAGGAGAAPLPSRKWLILVGVTIPSVLGCIDFTIVNTALPAIGRELDAGVSELQWVVNGFLLALSSFMVLAGRAADIYGRRRVLYLGLAGFGIASLGAGLTTDIAWLIAARVLQGASCAILYTASASIVADAFPDAERGRALGLLFGANGVGLAIGPAIGGVLVTRFGWPSIFLVNVPLIVLGFLICAGSLHETRGTQSAKLDVAGTILLLIALPLLVVGILQGPVWGWASTATLGVLVGSAFAFVALVRVERRADDPILPLHVLATPAFAGSVLATAALAAFYCTVFFLVPILLQTVRGLNSETAGLVLLAATLTVAAASPVAGRLVDRFGARTVLAAGFMFFVASAALQAGLSAEGSLGVIVAALLLMGVGWAFILGPSTAAAISALPASTSGLAVGIASTIHNLGGAIGLAVSTLLFGQIGGSILEKVAGRELPSGALAESLVSRDHLAALLGSGEEATKTLFAQSFAAGLHAAAWFLLILSLTTLLFVLRLIPARSPGDTA